MSWNHQRKLGSNTSELRMTFTWWNWLWWRVVREWDLTLMKGGVSLCITWQYSRKELTLMKGGVRLYTTEQYMSEELTLMKGGARVRLDGIDYDEGWCASETWPWWRVVWAFALHDNTAEKNWLWWRVVWDFTLHNNTSEKNWPWWRVVWDFTLHNNTWVKNWLWWRVVWDFTLHDNTSGKNLLWWRVVVRLYTTWQYIRKELTLSFAASGCSCVRSPMRFLNLWLQIAMEWLLHCLSWLHECCMGYVLGRKPEHETLCFSV